MKFTYPSVSFTFTPVHLTALFPVPHSQCPLLVVLLQETRADKMTCTNAVHKNKLLYSHSVICVLELGSDPTPQMYERWRPFCHPSINHPQECCTMQAKLGESHTYGEDAHKTFIKVEKTY